MKTINNKQYEECSLVMLATDKAENCLLIRGIKLEQHKQYFTQSYLKNLNIKSYHLYILSDEEINEGDWYITKTNDIIKCGNKTNFTPLGKKIIATTDKSLSIVKEKAGDNVWTQQLPQIPQSFIEHYIEQYNNGNVIDKVLVEYLLNETGNYREFDSTPELKYKLKINSDNTINILNQKDSWNREEVINLMEKSIQRGIQLKTDLKVIHKKDHIDKWIEENL